MHLAPYTMQHPTAPYDTVQHSTPYTLHPSTLHPAPCTLHPAPCTLHPAPSNLHPASCTLHPAPSTLHPPLPTLHPTTLAPYTSPLASCPSPPLRFCHVSNSSETLSTSVRGMQHHSVHYHGLVPPNSGGFSDQICTAERLQVITNTTAVGCRDVPGRDALGVAQWLHHQHRLHTLQ